MMSGGDRFGCFGLFSVALAEGLYACRTGYRCRHVYRMWNGMEEEFQDQMNLCVARPFGTWNNIWS